MRRYLVATILLLALTGTAHAATPSDASASERRTALVIGNSDYELISPLRNPVNDARAMARVLGDLGFEVIAKENLDQKEMKRAIRDFGRKLGQGGVGLFYYAGHGIEVGGENFMVPLNAPIQFEDDVDVEAVSVNLLLAKLASAANRLNIVILDACRNNPYSRSFRSSASGLATMDAPTGTYIAYAAAPGRVALDGEGNNGLYTGELLKALPLPGLKIEDAFKRVRVAVQDKSGTQQVPWESSSLTGDFYFKIDVSVTVEAPETPQAAPKPEIVLWQSIENSVNPAMFDAYLRQFPDGTFADVARLKRDTLIEAEQKETQTAVLVPPPEPSIVVEEMDATFVALKTSNVRAEPTTGAERVGRLTRDDAVAVTGKVTDRNWYRIEHEGETAYIFGTLIKEVDPRELAAWERVADTSDPANFEEFLAEYSSGMFAERARVRRDELATLPSSSAANTVDLAFWNSVEDSVDPKDLNAYLSQFPSGAFAVLARNRLEKLKEKQVAVVAPPPSTIPSTQATQPAVGVYPKTYNPGDTFKDCDICPEMVVIPAGSFMMGSPSYEEGRDNDEGPQHRVTIHQPFAVSKYEITFRQWDACLALGGCNGYWPDDKGWGRSNRPVINVSWNDVQAYLLWLSRTIGTQYRLLSEVEWEYVTRADTTTPFHFGSTISADQVNYMNVHGEHKTVPVGSFPSNAFGLNDVHGNVFEWVGDCWNNSYARAPSDGAVWTRGECGKRVLRGGSWSSEPTRVRSAYRLRDGTAIRSFNYGFRVARTLP